MCSTPRYAAERSPSLLARATAPSAKTPAAAGCDAARIPAGATGGSSSMATITYAWISAPSSLLLNNNVTTGNQHNPAIAGDAARTRYFAAWDQPSFQFMGGRIVSSNGTPVTNEFPPHVVGLENRFDPSVAGLANGNFVVTYNDFSAGPDGDIHAMLFGSDGVPVSTSDIVVNAFPFASEDSDVAALADGGFVVTWTDDFGANDLGARVDVR